MSVTPKRLSLSDVCGDLSGDNYTLNALQLYAYYSGQASVHIDLIEKAALRGDMEAVLCRIQNIREIEKEFGQAKLELQLRASIAEDCHDRHCDPDDFNDGGIPYPGK